MDGIVKSLGNFMQHPILHYQHTERPIGTITKAEIVDRSLYIEASIYDTSDTDDVWTEIQSGRLNKFSIYARRRHGNEQCRISPENRTSPCVTKGLDLWSISAVGENAINQMTFLEVVKALRGVAVTDTEDVIEKGESDAQGVSPPVPELAKAETNPSEFLGRIATLEKSVAAIAKSFEERDAAEVQKCGCMEKSEEPEKKEEEPAEVKKAAPEEEIVKADVIQKAVDEITKAFTARFDALDLRLTEMEEQTIQKGGKVTIIADQLSDDDRAALNPLIANAKATGGI